MASFHSDALQTQFSSVTARASTQSRIPLHSSGSAAQKAVDSKTYPYCRKPAVCAYGGQRLAARRSANRCNPGEISTLAHRRCQRPGEERAFQGSGGRRPSAEFRPGLVRARSRPSGRYDTEAVGPAITDARRTGLRRNIQAPTGRAGHCDCRRPMTGRER